MGVKGSFIRCQGNPLRRDDNLAKNRMILKRASSVEM